MQFLAQAENSGSHCTRFTPVTHCFLKQKVFVEGKTMKELM